LVLGSFFMMAGRMFMVLSSFCVVVCTLLAHRGLRSGVDLEQDSTHGANATTAGCQTLEQSRMLKRVFVARGGSWRF
jgi:hypothetical protein